MTTRTDPMPSRSDCHEIVVVEDDPVLRDTIVDLIKEADFAKVVTAFDRGTDAIAHIRKQDCDILLVDIGLPDVSGVDVIQAVRAAGSQAEIMVVTSTQTPQKIIASIQAGASGYFLKANLREDLIPYLKALQNGGSPIDPVIARRLLDMIRPGMTPTVNVASAKPSAGSAPTTKPLSEQETRILTYVAKGFTSKEIAELLGLSPLTVSTHIRNIYRKLQVKTRTEAVFEASSQGLIPPVNQSVAFNINPDKTSDT